MNYIKGEKNMNYNLNVKSENCKGKEWSQYDCDLKGEFNK
jgi:hypothetical protein